MSMLETGRSHNKVLQFAYDVFGSEVFSLEVLHEVERSKLEQAEQLCIETWSGPLFNLVSQPRVPRREYSEAERRDLSERAKLQHRRGKLGRSTWRTR